MQRGRVWHGRVTPLPADQAQRARAKAGGAGSCNGYWAEMGRVGKEGVTTLCFLTQPHWLLLRSARNYNMHTPAVQHVWDLGFQIRDSGSPLTHLGFTNQPFLVEGLDSDRHTPNLLLLAQIQLSEQHPQRLPSGVTKMKRGHNDCNFAAVLGCARCF